MSSKNRRNPYCRGRRVPQLLQGQAAGYNVAIPHQGPATQQEVGQSRINFADGADAEREAIHGAHS